jgi:hypothetical protein
MQSISDPQSIKASDKHTGKAPDCRTTADGTHIFITTSPGRITVRRNFASSKYNHSVAGRFSLTASASTVQTDVQHETKGGAAGGAAPKG